MDFLQEKKGEKKKKRNELLALYLMFFMNRLIFGTLYLGTDKTTAPATTEKIEISCQSSLIFFSSSPSFFKLLGHSPSDIRFPAADQKKGVNPG
jgi:hypothetical protein